MKPIEQTERGIALSKCKYYLPARIHFHYASELRIKISNLVFFIPQRTIVAIMGFFAIVTAYSQRQSLSMAITQMVVQRNKSVTGDTIVCPAEDGDKFQVITNEIILYFSDFYRRKLFL